MPFYLLVCAVLPVTDAFQSKVRIVLVRPTNFPDPSQIGKCPPFQSIFSASFDFLFRFFAKKMFPRCSRHLTMPRVCPFLSHSEGQKVATIPPQAGTIPSEKRRKGGEGEKERKESERRGGGFPAGRCNLVVTQTRHVMYALL